MIRTEMKLKDRVYHKHVYYEDPVQTGTKAFRAEEVLSQTVTVDEIAFDADEVSMERMARVVSLAAWKYNQAIAVGIAPAEAYASVYNTSVPWKTFNNEIVTTTVEVLCRALEAAVHKLGETWVKYG